MLSEISSWKFLLYFFLIILNGLVWDQIIFNKPTQNTELYFLSVGQGDSELVAMQNDVRILIDGGPNNKVLNNLSEVLSPYDRYIDLAVLTHPDADHYAGLSEVFKRYKVGAFIYSGVDRDAQGFLELKKIIRKNNVPIIVLGEKDKISYLDNKFYILFPSPEFLKSKKVNDTTLVIKYAAKNFSALFMGDSGKDIEKYLADKYDIEADILKVAHHGSKFSSTQEFLQKVSPKISVIEVGKNSYGHPTKEVLSRLASIHSQIFRTDKDGIIKIGSDGEKLSIASLK